jgi:apolipoprotein N-acyltransferase
MTVHSLASSLTLTQITYYIGVDLANLLVIAICAFVGLLFHHYRNQRQYRRAGCGLLALIALLYAAGAYRLYDNPTKYHDDVKIRIIQPNIAQNRKWDRQETYDIITEIVKQTNQDLGDDIDYIFFPESTISGTYLDYDDQARLLWSAINGDAIKVFGHNKLARYGKHDYKIWNRLYVQQGQFMVDSYDKNILVPFGEYMPLRQYLPFEKITAGSIDFSRGGGNKIINRGKISFIPLICYEALFPYDLIADDDNDADVLVTISNDAWYGYSSGPYQHAYYARLRAVASGKPMIRVANTGISFMTDKVGRFIKKTKLAEKITIDTMLSQ